MLSKESEKNLHQLGIAKFLARQVILVQMGDEKKWEGKKGEGNGGRGPLRNNHFRRSLRPLMKKVFPILTCDNKI